MIDDLRREKVRWYLLHSVWRIGVGLFAEVTAETSQH